MTATEFHFLFHHCFPLFLVGSLPEKLLPRTMAIHRLGFHIANFNLTA